MEFPLVEFIILTAIIICAVVVLPKFERWIMKKLSKTQLKIDDNCKHAKEKRGEK